MWLIKTVVIFFLGFFMLERIAELGGTKEKRDLKTEILYIIEIVLCIVGMVWMFNL